MLPFLGSAASTKKRRARRATIGTVNGQDEKEKSEAEVFSKKKKYTIWSLAALLLVAVAIGLGLGLAAGTESRRFLPPGGDGHISTD